MNSNTRVPKDAGSFCSLVQGSAPEYRNSSYTFVGNSQNQKEFTVLVFILTLKSLISLVPKWWYLLFVTKSLNR